MVRLQRRSCPSVEPDPARYKPLAQTHEDQQEDGADPAVTPIITRTNHGVPAETGGGGSPAIRPTSRNPAALQWDRCLAMKVVATTITESSLVVFLRRPR
jgi:hypothetical protein